MIFPLCRTPKKFAIAAFRELIAFEYPEVRFASKRALILES
jgi:hypothetical protein